MSFFDFDRAAKNLPKPWLISDLVEDARGLIWGVASASTAGQSYVLVIERNNTLSGLNRAPGIRNGSLYIDADDHSIWMTNYVSGLFRYFEDRRVWEHIAFEVAEATGNEANLLLKICPAQRPGSGDWWLGTVFGLLFYRAGTGQTWLLRPPERPPAEAPRENVFSYVPLLLEADGSAWFAYNGGISHIDPYRQQFRPNSPLPADFHPQAIAVYPPSGELLFTKINLRGLFQVFARHPLTHRLRYAETPLPSLRCGFGEEAVKTLYSDRSGRIWVGFRQGLGWLDPLTLRLEIPNIKLSGCAKPGINTHTAVVWDFEETADGTIWMPSLNAGLLFYKRDKASPPPENTAAAGPIRPDQETLTNILRDRQGRWWLGTNGAGVAFYDPTTRQKMQFALDGRNPRGLAGMFVRALYEDKNGNIWVGTEQGLSRFLPHAPPGNAF